MQTDNGENASIHTGTLTEDSMELSRTSIGINKPGSNLSLAPTSLLKRIFSCCYTAFVIVVSQSYVTRIICY